MLNLFKKKKTSMVNNLLYYLIVIALIGIILYTIVTNISSIIMFITKIFIFILCIILLYNIFVLCKSFGDMWEDFYVIYVPIKYW